MKNILLNYFLTSDGSFKEHRQTFNDEPAEQDIPDKIIGPGFVDSTYRDIVKSETLERVVEELAQAEKDRAELKKEVEFLHKDKKLVLALRKEAFQEGKAEALAQIHERQKAIRDLMKKSFEMGQNLIALSGRIDLLKTESKDKLKEADKLMKPESKEAKEQVAIIEAKQDQIAADELDIKKLEEQKASPTTKMAESEIDDQIAAKKAEIAKLTEELKKDQIVEKYAALNAEAEDLARRAANASKQFDALKAELTDTQATIDEMLADTEASPEVKEDGKAGTRVVETGVAVGAGTDTSADKDLEKSRAEVDAKLKDYDARMHNRALGVGRGTAEEGQPIDENVVAASEAANKTKTEEAMVKDGKIGDVKRMDIYEKVRKEKVSPDTLKASTHDEIVTTCDVMINKLGLPESVVLWMGHNLDYINTDDFAKKYPKESPQYKAFKNPNPTEKEMAIIKQENLGYYLALDYLNNVKGNVARIHSGREAYEKNAGESGKEPVFAYTTAKASEIFRDFTNAIHDRDYSKLAMYGAFGYGIWTLYKNFFKGKEGEKPGGNWGLKNLLIYGLAAYAGGWLLDPEDMKTVTGLGRNIDFKGTNVEGFAEIQRAAAEGTYLKDVDPATLFKLHEARVEDVYGPITASHESYNDEFSNHDMVPLSNAGLARFYPADLIAQGTLGAANFNQEKGLTTKQKLYLDESRKLYKTAQGLKQMYNDKIKSVNGGISFEDMFVNKNSGHYRPNYTMGALYELFRPYMQAQTKITEGSNFEQAKKDMMEGGKLTEAFKSAKFKLDAERPAGQKTTGFIYGYPIDILRQKSPDDKKNQYVLSLRGHGELNVTYTAGEDSGIAASKMKEIIEKHLREFSKGVNIQDKGTAVDLKYDADKSVWGFPVTIPAQHLMKERQGMYEIKFEDGNPYFDFEGTRMNVVSSKDLPSADRSLAADLFAMEAGRPKCNFLPLRYLVEGDKPLTAITISNNNPSTKKFDITVLGVTVTIDSSSGKYVMSDADQKKFIENSQFREKYAEARLNSAQYKSYMESLESIFSRLNSKSFTSQITGAASSVYESILGSAPLSAMFNGSIPDNYLKASLEGQKQFLKNLLAANMVGTSTFEQLTTKTEVDINDRFSRVRAFASTIDSLPGRALSQTELRTLVLDPLRSMSYNSIVFADGARKFEKDVVSQLGVSDAPFKDDAVQKSADLWNVYYHFTASLDTAELDKPMIFDPADPSIFNRVKQRAYLEDVRKQINSKMGSFLDGKISSNPIDWGIKTYDEWVADPATIVPDISETLFLTPTEVEDELRLYCKKIVQTYAGNDYESVVQLLYTTYDTPIPPGASGGPTARLFFSAAAAPIATGVYPNRTSQIEAISKAADKFREQCDQQINDAKLADLKSQPGWQGRVNEWLYKNLQISF